MGAFFRNFRLDTTSFWIGALAGLLMAWLLGLLRKYLPAAGQVFRGRLNQLRESLTASTEARHRADVLRWTQSLHIAAPLFPLDAVILPPRVLISPFESAPGNGPGGDIVSQTLPYQPDWPELAAAFYERGLTLAEALSGGANLLLVGYPGMGKTTALAHLAGCVARQDESIGELGQRVPVFLHVTDLPPAMLSAANPLQAIIQAAVSRASPLTQPRLPTLLRAVFENGRALLLIDGLDEQTPETAAQYADYLRALASRYPAVRMVIAVAPLSFASLPRSDFLPVAIAGWNSADFNQFLDQWRQAWDRYIASPDINRSEDVDPLMINGWLQPFEPAQTPFDITLKTWAAYAGDALGPEYTQAIEAYLRRMTIGIANSLPALEQIARQMILTYTPTPASKEVEDWVFEFSQGETPTPEASGSTPAKSAVPRGSPRLVSALLNSGLISPASAGRLRFSHSILFGYLAGSIFSKSANTFVLENQPDWAGKTLALQNMACFTDVGAQLKTLLAPADDPLRRTLLAAARWLRVSPLSAPWRSEVLRALASALQKEHPTLGLSGRIMTALLCSRDPNLPNLFRGMLRAGQPNLRLLAALGVGFLRDSKSLNDLAILASDPNPAVGRAAYLAMIHIGGQAAIDTIATTLLQGNEFMRQTAAEALAADVEEGHPLLLEASKMDDLLVRRAAVAGLALVRLPWAQEVLEKMAIEDGQWVVRNAAAEALDKIRRGPDNIPQPPPALHETPWLIAFAAQFGIGVTPGKAAEELVLRALKDGDDAQKLGALQVLKRSGSETSLVQLYNAYYGESGEIRESAFEALWRLAAAGVQLPAPAQFGLG